MCLVNKNETEPTMTNDLSTTTRWFHLLAWFLGAMFLTNVIPHFVAGVSGSPFQSPFADPPGEGLSSARLNVIWGFINLVIAWALLRVGRLELRRVAHAAVFFAGILAMALMIGGHFARFHGGNI